MLLFDPLALTPTPLLQRAQILHANSCSGVSLSFLRLLLACYLTYSRQFQKIDDALMDVVHRWQRKHHLPTQLPLGKPWLSSGSSLSG